MMRFLCFFFLLCFTTSCVNSQPDCVPDSGESVSQSNQKDLMPDTPAIAITESAPNEVPLPDETEGNPPEVVIEKPNSNTGIKRFVRFLYQGIIGYGRLEEKTIYRLSGDFLKKYSETNTTLPLDQVKLLSPVVPSKVIAIGLNYSEHGSSNPSAPPPAFLKQPTCIVGTEQPILRPKGATNLHFEGELVLVIGKKARNVPESQSLSYIFGVTAGNDVSERTWQSNDLQWFRAKASDTFGPMGPTVVTGVDYQNLRIRTLVNGKVVQDSNTSKMIHSIRKIVSFVSSHMTLYPGDVIFTGTPGTTFAMKNGDKVEVEIQHVGTLSNTVQDKKP